MSLSSPGYGWVTPDGAFASMLWPQGQWTENVDERLGSTEAHGSDHRNHPVRVKVGQGQMKGTLKKSRIAWKSGGEVVSSSPRCGLHRPTLKRSDKVVEPVT